MPAKKLKVMTFADVIAEGERRAAEEAAKLAKMSPAERQAYEKAQKEAHEEIEKILKQLRGPGFVEIKL